MTDPKLQSRRDCGRLSEGLCPRCARPVVRDLARVPVVARCLPCGAAHWFIAHPETGDLAVATETEAV